MKYYREFSYAKSDHFPFRQTFPHLDHELTLDVGKALTARRGETPASGGSMRQHTIAGFRVRAKISPSVPTLHQTHVV